MRTAPTPGGHAWLRLADPQWADPMDASHAARTGGRWNRPGGEPTLYLNEDVATARANVRRFTAGQPYEPEDLDDRNGYLLVGVVLPSQDALDAHSSAGVAEAGLPATYPHTPDGGEVAHGLCQPIGATAADAGLDGVWCRSAAGEPTSGLRELAWFTRGRPATPAASLPFGDWYYGGSPDV